MKKFFYLVVLTVMGLFVFTTCESSIGGDGENKHKGHEYVDLGLPSGLKWATCNVGSNTPEGPGYYFAWGEVKPKEKYNYSTYKYFKIVNDEDIYATKYCDKDWGGENGFVDNKIVLEPEDDAATVNWGGKWRMPTKEEQYELKKNCIWTWTIQDGVKGYRVIGPNGNSIFLPLAGYMIGSTRYAAEIGGSYWSSSLYDDGPIHSYYLVFGLDDDNNNLDYIEIFRLYRSYGASVRPVCP